MEFLREYVYTVKIATQVRIYVLLNFIATEKGHGAAAGPCWHMHGR
jgi:hypothetical protein